MAKNKPRTFVVTTPAMKGADIEAWERTLNAQMKTWKVDYAVPEDGVYSAADRDLTATVCHGLGLASATGAMRNGLTPALRVKLRNKDQTPAEKQRFKERASWRTALRKRHESKHIHSPLNKILGDSWGWHPGIHDGEDLICDPNAVCLAICDAEVIDVRSSGWWGKGAQSSGGHSVSEGDGIVQLRCLTDVGPFKVGMHFGYGHCEHAKVHVGQIVKAGDPIALAGFANAWHIHFMVNGGGTTRGVGDRDPRPFVDYAVKNG